MIALAVLVGTDLIALKAAEEKRAGRETSEDNSWNQVSLFPMLFFVL